MTHTELSNFIYSIANLLRGPYRPPQYRRVMLPMTVLRRLDCVLEPTKDKVLEAYKVQKAKDRDAELTDKVVRRKFRLPFINASKYTFKKLLDDPDGLARNLSLYIKGFSPEVRKILDKFEFEKEIEKLDKANRLFQVVQAFTSPSIDLHPDRVPNTLMGHVFEDLVRRFNEAANEEAGDHFTPREVIRLMVHVLFEPDGDVFTKAGKAITLYDPCCGTGGMLSVAEEYLTREGRAAGLKINVYGQEYNEESFAICGSDLLIKGEDTSHIVFGDTLGDGKSNDGFADARHKFHYMLANPPFGVEWKPEKDVVEREHALHGFNGRFGPGLPRINDGSLLFLLHMLSKRRSVDKGGSRIGIVFNGSPLFTGDAGGGESEIRRWIIENDWLEAIIGLPDQMFYNTGIYTYVWIVSNRKPERRRGKVQLIDGTDFYRKMKKSLGDKRNEMSEDHIAELTRLYGDMQDGTHSRIFHNQDFGYIKLIIERPLRLNFQASPQRIERLSMQSAFAALAESKKRKDAKGKAADEVAGRALQTAILVVLQTLDPAQVWKSRPAFVEALNAVFDEGGLKVQTPVRKAIFAALSERDPQADICREKDAQNGAPEADADLRDTEHVPLPRECPLPLPLAYGDKPALDALLPLITPACVEYFEREVQPHVPDAWIAWDKTRIGFEIPFNRHFYTYQPPRDLAEIEAELKTLETDIVRMLGELTA
ncbi:MAG: class I SAM-dependent DNA methyltransferase [Luteimonas sp.]